MRQWVFFDEYNTSDAEGYLSEILTDRRFKGRPLSPRLLFLAACNPYKLKTVRQMTAGLENTSDKGSLVYRVFPVSQSVL